MKTISDFTIYCTPEQTMKALELGATIIDGHYYHKICIINNNDYATPTAEQMIGFILDSGKGYAVDLAALIKEYGYKQGCLTFIDNCLK